MKRIQLFNFIFFLSVSAGYSQFNKGSLLIGADLSFNTQSYSNGTMESKSHGFFVAPMLAVATKQNMFWGGSLNIAYSKSNNSAQVYHSYGGSILFRKYKQVAGRLFAFVEPAVMISFTNNKNNNGPNSYSESKGFNSGLNIKPGVSINVSKKIYLEAGFSNVVAINYGHNKTTTYNPGSTTHDKSNSFIFSSSLGSFSNNLYFGFRFIIPKNS